MTHYEQAYRELTALGYQVKQSAKVLSFIRKGNRIQYFVGSEWATGKGIEDGRGLDALLNQLDPIKKERAEVLEMERADYRNFTPTEKEKIYTGFFMTKKIKLQYIRAGASIYEIQSKNLNLFCIKNNKITAPPFTESELSRIPKEIPLPNNWREVVYDFDYANITETNSELLEIYQKN